MDPLGQLYLVCTFLGWGFIIATFALGQFGHGHSGQGDGHHMGDGGGHIGGGQDAGIHGAAGGGHHMGVHTAAHAAHVGGHTDVGGHGHGHVDGHGQGHGHAHGDGHDNALENTRQTTANPVVKSRDNQLYFTLLGIFSPVTMSVFTGFFGSAGYIAWHYFPWLSFFTLIPAVISGLIAVNFVKRVTGIIVSKLAASSLTRKKEAIGRIAQVNTPIVDGRLGEVSYVIGTSRFNASAKAAHAGQEFARGSKVMIVDTEGPVVFVEPASDIDLALM
jgi:membrane protein implicated in regulation of membrane protease activity